MYTGIYLRSSRRDPVALARQEELLVKLCRENGWEYKVYQDEAVKGGGFNLPGLKKLLEEARQGGVKQVLVTSFDRLAKQQEELEEIVRQFRACGVEVLDWNLNTPRFEN